ncbi:PDZ domain-containing protein [Streptomyces tropicalis]|uniref:PDZ domain-containing protein n=1 Tax=Streptomyces tropicalis TaxID=3034234 RepID=UPI0028BDA192|nr:PDZ domain-containing protein [Streptomyces tropicalis]
MVLFGLGAGVLLLLTGVGLGAVGAAVLGASRATEPPRRPPTARAPATLPGQGATGSHPAPADAAPEPVRTTLGIEVADDDVRPGARVVAVHVPGPGYTAGLVRGDVLLALGRTRIRSAADLARAVARSAPGHPVLLTVRHGSGAHRQLTAALGVAT